MHRRTQLSKSICDAPHRASSFISSSHSLRRALTSLSRDCVRRCLFDFACGHGGGGWRGRGQRLDFFGSIGRGALSASDAGCVGEGIDVGYLTSAGAVYTSIATSTITRIRAMGPMCPTTAPRPSGNGSGTVKGRLRLAAVIGNVLVDPVFRADEDRAGRSARSAGKPSERAVASHFARLDLRELDRERRRRARR